jgi:hypothetical protein
MGQGVIAMLESITAADKAQSVPVVEIWRIDPTTGQPIFGSGGIPRYPLTLSAISPPLFGASIDSHSELRERPDASFESITIKTNNPIGLILYRTLDISLVIHRPESLSVKVNDRDSWRDLITPGAVFAMRYGWSANPNHVKNPIMNGVDEIIRIDGKNHLINGTKTIRFAITNYRFTILSDQQIRIQIAAIEDGDYGMRHTYVVPGVRPSVREKRLHLYDPKQFQENFVREANVKIRELTNDLRKRSFPRPRVGLVVRLEDIFDVFFVKQAEESIKKLGYNTVNFYMGTFNERAPEPHEQYRSEKPTGRQTPERYIGDFCVPFDSVIQKMSQMVFNGQEMTLFNFIIQFLRTTQDPRVWKNLNDVRLTMPEVSLRFKTIENRERNQMIAEIYVFDVKVELTRFTADDKIAYQRIAEKNSANRAGIPNRDKIKEICGDRGVPYVEFMKGNSWIQDAQFDVIQDELLTSIFITRYYHRDRMGITTEGKNKIIDDEIDHRATLYSSAIKGQITVIGNHAMDVMGLYWLDFGVPQWSGPFRVLERTDLIQPGGWQATISFVSEGSDPLGSQGRPEITPGMTVGPPPVSTKRLVPRRSDRAALPSRISSQTEMFPSHQPTWTGGGGSFRGRGASGDW